MALPISSGDIVINCGFKQRYISDCGSEIRKGKGIISACDSYGSSPSGLSSDQINNEISLIPLGKFRQDARILRRIVKPALTGRYVSSSKWNYLSLNSF
jgi:hypothetical protein